MKGLYGDLGAIATGPQEALSAYPDYMVGIGAFMEGIDQNVVVYDLLFVGQMRRVNHRKWRGERRWTCQSGCTSTACVATELTAIG